MSISAVSKPYGFLDSDGVLIYPLNRFEDGDFPFAMPPFSVGFPEDIVTKMCPVRSIIGLPS